MATTPASPSAPSNGSVESLGQKPPRLLEALRKLPNGLTESSPGYEIFKNLQKNMASSEWNHLLFMKSNTHICPSLETVTKKHHQKLWRSPWYPLPNTPFLTILWPVFFSAPCRDASFNGHGRPYDSVSCKDSHESGPEGFQTRLETWKRRRKRGNCQCDCKCAYSTMILILVKKDPAYLFHNDLHLLTITKND